MCLPFFNMQTFHSAFDEVHDVAVFGGGWAGFAAARALVEAGRKTLLIDRRAALLAESGWSFQSTAGHINGIEWRDWLEELTARDAARDGQIDGALAETIATKWAHQARRDGKLQVLFYTAPLALEGGNALGGERLEAVLLGTKAGLRRVAATQWIDATESGELLQLFARVQGNLWQTPPRLLRFVRLYFRHANWPDLPCGPLDNQSVAGARLSLEKTIWPNERCLTVTVTGEGENYGAHLRGSWIPSLQALHANFPEAMREAVLTHGSVEPFDVFSRVPQMQSIPPNMVAAVPWMRRGTADTFLAGRFELGSMAARRILDLPTSQPQANTPFKGEIFWHERASEIAVAGLGTGGALATLAAARNVKTQDAVLGFDPLSFCGGIGAGGGIHWYYFGVKGGLQDELDVRQREVMPLFASSGQIQGFHPDAKKCVLETMLRESGAELLFGATLLDVERDGSRVKSALLSTPNGPLRLTASAWIDSTGDGDLAARAGAPSRFGRDGDGLLHAYSQSSGKASLKNDKAFMNVVNYDAGFVDPTDSEDLTRARLEGIVHYAKESYSQTERPTYIAPAIGLRQSRHIVTDYTLELSDLIERREFDDAVGLTGCHYDNHAVDYEFESEESLLWVWVCRQWRGRIACEIPYRILLPQGLDNVWLACRALGVSQDAHHSLRMQRDMQRIGEVAGLAATLAPQGQSRAVPFDQLRDALHHSGALQSEVKADDNFGPDTKSDAVLSHDENNVSLSLDALQNAPADESFEAPWHLYRAGQNDNAVRQRVLALLDSENVLASWRAAAIAALWGETAAQNRLLRAITERGGIVENSDGDRDKTYRCEVPNWLVAVSLLRSIGGPECLPVLSELADDQTLLHNARTAIALCCEGIATRHDLSEGERETILEILWKLIENPAPNSLAPPQRPLMKSDFAGTNVLEDWSWQIHLSVARARRALGLPPHQQAVACLQDERALVRRAFQLVCADLTIEVPL